MEYNRFWLFVISDISGFCTIYFCFLLLGVRNLGRGRWGVIGKWGKGACAGEWADGKRVIV